MNLMETLMHNARQAAGVQATGKKPSGDNATIPGADTKTKGEGTAPAALAQVLDPKDDKSPLAGFVDLWKTGDSQPLDLSKAVTFDLDPAKLAEAAKALDFTKAIDPKLAEAALKGDANALSAVLQSVSQSSYVQSAALSAKLIEAALAKQADAFKAALPNLVKRATVNENLRGGDNSEFLNHPAVAPLVSLLEQQLTEKYPKASAAEITTHARKYMTGLGDILSGKAKKAATELLDGSGTKGLGDDNWSDFAGYDLGKGLPT